MIIFSSSCSTTELAKDLIYAGVSADRKAAFKRAKAILKFWSKQRRKIK